MISSGLLQEVSVRPHMRSSSDSASLLQKKMACVSVRNPPPKTPVHALFWTFCVMRNEPADRLAGKTATSNGSRLGTSEVLRNVRHYLQGLKAKDITPTIAWRREAWKEEAVDDLPLKGRKRAIVNQTNIGTVSKATVGKRLRNWLERLWLQAHQIKRTLILRG